MCEGPSPVSTDTIDQPTNQPTPRPSYSGFGFVVYENQRDAEEAISRMDNAELDGRTLRVNFARPK